MAELNYLEWLTVLKALEYTDKKIKQLDLETKGKRTHFIVLNYGNRDLRIRTDGHNAMCILSQLYHNEVVEAILK